MPELLPRAFDNLLPHMLPDVVPLISQPLIDYLRGRTPARGDSPPEQDGGAPEAGTSLTGKKERKTAATAG
jgi:hypothetical protein